MPGTLRKRELENPLDLAKRGVPNVSGSRFEMVSQGIVFAHGWWLLLPCTVAQSVDRAKPAREEKPCPTHQFTIG
jgi:hypothetical protein